MPTLTITKTYQDGDVLLEADLDAIRASITTFINTTKLDDSNIQAAGITRATKLKAGTANYVVINAADGTMSEEATLATSRGGLGFAPSFSAGNVGYVVAVKDDFSGLQLRAAGETPMSKALAFYRFT
jgi:hypothetical protein